MKARIFRVRLTALFLLAMFAVVLVTVPDQSDASYGRVPSFKVYPNGSVKATWNTPVGAFTYTWGCVVERADRYISGFRRNYNRASRPNGGRPESQGFAPFNVWCTHGRLELPDEIILWDEINIGGYERELSDFRLDDWSVRAPLKFIQESIENDEVFDVEIYKGGLPGLRDPESYTFYFRPSDGYSAYLTELFEQADRENMKAAVAKKAEDKRQRIILGAGLIGGVIALALLVKVLRSGPARRGAGAVRSCIAAFSRRLAGLIRRPKISLKRKGNLKAAQELMYWSELKDKGDISQEEFEERKKKLLGKT